MKLYFRLITSFVLILNVLLFSCEKQTYPIVFQGDIDTTLYPGNFNEYEFPDFGPNPNTTRNVLIEDYTGHQCAFCPPAAAKAIEISNANPERIFVTTIHASPEKDGKGILQSTDDVYLRDFTNKNGLEMAILFENLEVGFNNNPKGTINRVPNAETGNFFLKFSLWEEKTKEVLASKLDVNIQAKSNYFPETNSAYIHTETEFLNQLTGDYNIVAYIIEKEYIGPQTMPGYITNPTYKHHDIHIGNLFDETWGRPVVSGNVEKGTKVKTDFSYTIPDGLQKNDIHFIITVINRKTFEIMQVIKHEL